MGVLGMLICRLATYAVMPPLIVLYESWRPLPVAGPHARPPVGKGASFVAGLVTGRPKLVTAFSLGLVLVSAFTIHRFSQDPVQYDFTKLGSREGLRSGAAYWDSFVDAVMQSYQTPTVILTDSREQAAAVRKAMEAAQDKAGAASTVASVDTLEKLIPTQQPEKLALLGEIISLLGPRALARLEPADRQLVERILKNTRLEPVAEKDLPPRLSRFFHEKDGRSGLLVMVYPTLESDSRHGRALVRHAVEVREAALGAAPSVRVAGQLVLTADIIKIITDDGLLSGVLSFAAVAVLTLLAMRSFRHAAWVLASLCLGVLWMFGVLGLFAIKFNFVNFVVLPITFGIGADYAVNFYQRYRETGSARAALASSGGAVTLCSSTTIIGYAALLVADNQAIQSFGLTAVIGEFTCLSAALLALPALLSVRDGANQRKAGATAAAHPEERA
jgi:predicted RND superfamily exporter protein